MISIHPMLLFNPYSGHTSHSETVISIHPMLLFNRLLIKQLIKNFYFNTSHVIIQPLFLFHLHLENLFQYIPCYYSTFSTMCGYSVLFQFQYIPCYYSTRLRIIELLKAQKFQYIPCYYSTWKKHKRYLVN